MDLFFENTQVWELQPDDPEAETLPTWVHKFWKAGPKRFALALETGVWRMESLDRIVVTGRGDIYLELTLGTSDYTPVVAGGTWASDEWRPPAPAGKRSITWIALSAPLDHLEY